MGCVLPASLLALGARLLGPHEREGQAAGFGIVVVIVGGVAGAVGALVGLVIAAETGGDPELWFLAGIGVAAVCVAALLLLRRALAHL